MSDFRPGDKVDILGRHGEMSRGIVERVLESGKILVKPDEPFLSVSLPAEEYTPKQLRLVVPRTTSAPDKK